jgi:hypothetical protein
VTTNRVLRGVPEGGQFAPSAHAEPGITLAAERGYDPEAVAKGILADLRDIPERWTSELFYTTHQEARAGKVSFTEFLDGLIAKNRGGRCELHEHDASHSPEQRCRDCHVAFMVEARTNPKPLPSPRGIVPVRPTHHHLNREQISREYDPATKVENTRTKVSGDEKFEAAIRNLFGAPDDAPVEIVQADCEYGTDWTRESDTEITVKCGDREATYSYMGALMQDLDRKDRNPEAMALRFMQATVGERPLLLGTAAVYLDRGEHRDPEPVFGKIRNVFSGHDASMDFLYLDGRQDYIHFNRVVAILETDQSSEYNESE